MTSELRARVLDEADYGRWERFVSTAPAGSLYSTAEYLDALCSATGGRFKILAVEKGTEILGGIALYEERSRLGAFVSDRRLLYYNGVALREYDTKYPSVRTSRHLEIVEALLDALTPMGYASARFKSRAPFTDPRAFLARGWRAEPAFTYVVPLTDVKRQWERVEQNLRRLVERCAEQGGAFGEDADFDGFFRLHAATSDRKRAPIYLPHGAFRQYFEKLRARGLCKLYCVRWTDRRPIAAQLVLLGNHRVTHTVSAAADVNYQKTGANAFLRWKTFEALAALGYHGNDLTDASLNPVTHFKSQLGGDLTTAWVVQSPESFAFKAGRALQRLRSRVG